MTEFRIQNSEFRTTVFLILLFVLFIAVLNKKAGAELTIRTNTGQINIDSFYHGSTMELSGISEPETELILKITSSTPPQSFRKKDKLAGLFWMNSGKLVVERAPVVYLLYSTKKLDYLLSDEEKIRHLIGYSALNKYVEISPIGGNKEKDGIFQEFVKLKEASGLYSISKDKVLTTLQNGKQLYNIKLDWPYQAAPEEYLITVYAIKDGKVVETADTIFHVQQTGIVKELAALAKNNSILYGIVSILAAIAAGFGVGLIFGKGRSSH